MVRLSAQSGLTGKSFPPWCPTTGFAEVGRRVLQLTPNMGPMEWMNGSVSKDKSKINSTAS